MEPRRVAEVLTDAAHAAWSAGTGRWVGPRENGTIEVMGDKSRNERMVSSSAAGRICRGCGQPERCCRCGEAASAPVPDRPAAKLRLETAGRGGKTVTVVFGLPNNDAFLKDLAQQLKRACGTGGTT